MPRPACHRPPSLPPHIPFDGGISHPRMVRRSRIQYSILFLLGALYGLYVYTENVIFLYVAGAGVGILVLGALAWTGLMCMILWRDEDGGGDGDEEMGRSRGGNGKEKLVVRREDEGDEVGMGLGKEEEKKVDGLQESIERALARRGISIEVGW